MSKMSNILCGKNIVDNIKSALSLCRFAVTDSNVADLYPEFTEDAFVIPAGESNKNPQTLFSILSEMERRKIKRGDTVAAIGGGVTGDITGLAASLYMRGVDWVNVPTSLLAMVDAGIGGKTAIDYNGVKNLVGAFHAPSDIFISSHFLATLPEREWICGTGELIKTCMLSKQAYETFKAHAAGLQSHDPDEVFALIKTCVDIKNAVVKADLNEKNLRKILNVGHTIGHALESVDNYRLSHGEYVIKGMMTEIAMCKDIVDPKFYREIIATLKKYSAPPRTTAKSVVEKALLDKKNVGHTITVMLVAAPGDVMEVKMELEDFFNRYNDAVKELKTA